MRREIPVQEPPSGPPGGRRYVLLAVAVVLVGLAGYAGYVIYPRFGLAAEAGAALLLLAVGAGTASFFSPCSFPLLLTLLGRQVRPEPGAPPGLGGVLAFAAAFSAGAVAFVLLLGLLIGLGGRALAASITFTSPAGITLRIVVGLALVLLGLVQAEVLPVSFHAVDRITRPLAGSLAVLRRRRPLAGAAAFGFGYLLAGFG